MFSPPDRGYVLDPGLMTTWTTCKASLLTRTRLPRLETCKNDLWTRTIWSSNKMSQEAHFACLLPSCDKSWRSITETKAYALLYNDKAAIDHFKAYKNELPPNLVMRNQAFINTITFHEPGLKIDYFSIRDNIARIRPEYEGKEPIVFDVIDNLIRRHAEATAAAAELINFDVFFNIMKSYYLPMNDTPLLRAMSTINKKNPQAFVEYLGEAQKFQENKVLARIQKHLKLLQSKTEMVWARFVALKNMPELIDIVGDLQRMRETHDYFRRAENDIRRVIRQEELHVRGETIREECENNRLSSAGQLGQLGRIPLRQHAINAIAVQNERAMTMMIDGMMTAEAVRETAARRGWQLHPDSWEAMNPASEDATDNTTTRTQTSSNTSAQAPANRN